MIDYKTTPISLESHVLDREGCPIHYWVGGAAKRPLLVFMHGATMDHRMFNAQVEALAADYRVLVWDARGHGQSTPVGAGFNLDLCARDMLAVLDAVGVETAVIGGQSLGGYIAQTLYRIAPQRVQAMIVIGSTPIAKAYSKLEMWTLKATMPLFNVWPYGNFVNMVATNTAITPAVQEYALAAASQINRDDFLTIWKAVTLAVDDKGLPNFTIDVPLLLIHGDQDKTGTIRRDMPLWAAWEPQATYHVIPHAGHNANQDNAAFTNETIRTFLNETAL
ncbi:MAG: alpha/beta fold hydrolase [Anaerolineae bacterium]|nr:alpha/beta fold hydrolase [Anaerolineae bacterium]